MHKTPEEPLRQQAIEQLSDAGFIEQESDFTLAGSPLVVDNNYVSNHLNKDGFLITAPVSPDAVSDQWLKDDQGKLHPLENPWQCMTPEGSRLTLEDCSTTRPEQRWLHDDEARTLRNAATHQCIDFDRAGNRLLMYGCHGNWNQRWTLDASAPALWLTWLPSETLQQLLSLFAP